MEYKPFFINSNICLNNDDVQSYDRFMQSVAKNTGNSYITYSLIKETMTRRQPIKHIQNIFCYDFEKNQDADIDYINNACTHCYLVLQDQIRITEAYGHKLPFEKIQNFISKLNKPVIIAGVGANTTGDFIPHFEKQFSPELVNFLKFLSNHCIQIGVRGHYTEEILHNLGIDNTRVIGCPTYYEMGPNRKVDKKQNIKSEDILLLRPFYVKQLRSSHVMCQDIEEDVLYKPINFGYMDDKFNISDIETYLKLYNERYHIFSDMQGWRNFIRKFKFSIGPRVHGSIISINAGVPAICTFPDSRAREMCEYMGIPYCNDINPDSNVVEICNTKDISSINEKYPELYKNYNEFLKENGVELLETAKYEIKQPKLSSYKYEDVKNKKTYEGFILKSYSANSYFKTKINAKDYVAELTSVIDELKGRKVIIYDDGKGFELLDKKYALSKKLNITAIANVKFKIGSNKTFSGIKAISPLEMTVGTYDCILVLNECDVHILDYLKIYAHDVDKVRMVMCQTIKEEKDNLSYLADLKFEKRVQKLLKKLKNKRVMLYGAGIFSQAILNSYDLSGLNIVGIADKKYSNPESEKNFMGYNTYAPEDIPNINPDYVLVGTKRIIPVIKNLKSLYLNDSKIKVIPLVKKGFWSLLQER